MELFRVNRIAWLQNGKYHIVKEQFISWVTGQLNVRLNHSPTPNEFVVYFIGLM